jgi:hypothetical protein
VDRVRVGGVAPLAIAAEGAAQLAIVVFIHALTDQQGSVAAVAVLDLAGDVTEAAAQEGELELGRVADGGLHETGFGREASTPANAGCQCLAARTRRRTDEEPCSTT